MAAELEVYDDGEDVGLTTAQINALEKLDAMGAEPAEKDPETGKSIYSSNAQVRALQLVAEGRLGGAGRGQGRKPKPRVGQFVAEEMRKRGAKIVAAIDNALDSDNEKIALSAADMAVRIDRDEALVDLKQQEVDNVDNMSREDLVDAIIQLASAPATAAQLEQVIDIPEEDIQDADVVLREDTSDDKPGKRARRTRTASRSAKARSDKGPASRNGRGSASGSREKGGNPFTSAAGGRSSD